MKKHKLFVGVCLLLLTMGLCMSSLTACRMHSQNAYSATYMDETFDTVLTITVGASDIREANTHCRAIKAIVSDLHRVFDAYNLYPGVTNIAAINRTPVGTPVKIPADIQSLLALGQQMYDCTEGKVHIGMGTLTGIWKTAIAEKKLPDPGSVSDALRQTPPLTAGMRLDEQAGTVTRLSDGLVLDVGAIAKGYALDRIRAYAEEQGLRSLLCNLGGEIVAIGSAPDGNPWKISIADPDGGTRQTLEIENAAIATGGDYERFFVADGKRYHHMIDPATGYPTETYRSVSVIMPLGDAARADAYSTALMMLPAEYAERLVAERAGGAYLLIHPDGSETQSRGWGDYLP